MTLLAPTPNLEFQRLIPPRDAVEDRYLRGSLSEYGCLGRLIAWNGWLLDGHRRDVICRESGIDCRFDTVELPSADAAAVWVGLQHVARHDLDVDRRAAACANMIRSRGTADRGAVDAGSDGRLPRGLTKKGLADIADVSARRVSDALKVAEADSELFDEVYTGAKPLAEVKRRLRHRDDELRRRAMAARVKRLTRDVRHGRFQKRLADLPDESVDLIFTDPPYHKHHVHLYHDLALLAARVLRPGGSLICYAGVHALPTLLPMMTGVPGDLRFWWQLCLRHSASFPRQHGWRVHVHYKPLLWFVRGTYRGPYMVDVIESRWLGKNWHGWEQSEAEAAHCIERLCPEGGLVVDPMCGSGTTLLAAKRLGRRWIGVDKDRQSAQLSQARLRELCVQTK